MNILLIQIKRIGDLILTTPAIAAVRKKFPEAKITLALASGSRELLPAISGVDEALFVHSSMGDAVGWVRLLRNKYDYSFDFARTDRSAFLTLLSGARKRVTADHPRFRAQLRSFAYNELVDLPISEMHTVDYHLALLEPLGIGGPSRKIVLELPATAIAQADRVLSNAGVAAGEFLILHPGSARLEKFWEADRWATIVGIAAEHGLKCIITGGRSAEEQAHILQIRALSRQRVIDLSGQLDLLTLAALIKRAKLLTTVDSAPMHLAVATETPQVVLFGPTNPLHWGPRFTPAVILQAGQAAPVSEFNPKQKAVPMNLLSTEQVISGMRALLMAPQAAVSA